MGASPLNPSPSGEGGLGCGSIRAGRGHGAERYILQHDVTPPRSLRVSALP